MGCAVVLLACKTKTLSEPKTTRTVFWNLEADNKPEKFQKKSDFVTATFLLMKS